MLAAMPKAGANQVEMVGGFVFRSFRRPIQSSSTITPATSAMPQSKMNTLAIAVLQYQRKRNERNPESNTAG
jgi:CRISPR/Cas system CMR-associated protein Cmr3 (group 5 of RAMP superfamily)